MEAEPRVSIIQPGGCSGVLLLLLLRFLQVTYLGICHAWL
jgi:hypothetical protein